MREMKQEWKQAHARGEVTEKDLRDTIRFGRRANSPEQPTRELPTGKHGYVPPTRADVEAVRNLPD